MEDISDSWTEELHDPVLDIEDLFAPLSFFETSQILKREHLPLPNCQNCIPEIISLEALKNSNFENKVWKEMFMALTF